MNTIATFKQRLRRGFQVGKAGADLEAYTLETTDVESLTQDELRRLQWICENVIWPETRPRRRKLPNPTPPMFDF